ncbi:peptidoglycan editing factor PgeF [Novosphingobium bradum]|uniref:Purine nucleoside phosphorylase n=1 Tax=Novosphingobium bradum TaxID=1737444 RepID=A0ABV7IWE4_9SPHN
MTGPDQNANDPIDIAPIDIAPIDIARAEGLAAFPHGFLGRTGGVSTGVAASLNVGLGSGDDEAAVRENRRRAAEAVAPGARLVGLYQVHSARCVTVTEPWDDHARPEADALVTDRPGLLLGVLTADCAPVLFADRAAGVVGAAHAGWKGALAGVTDATLAAMVALGARPDRIAAAIGPCIAQSSYEVDEAFRARFVAADAGNAGCFGAGREGHWQFDLPGYLARRLVHAGIGAVERLGLDTYSQEHRYFSFRRSTHRHEAAYGRQISAISLPPPPG